MQSVFLTGVGPLKRDDVTINVRSDEAIIEADLRQRVLYKELTRPAPFPPYDGRDLGYP